jgi:hypothetical protein
LSRPLLATVQEILGPPLTVSLSELESCPSGLISASPLLEVIVRIEDERSVGTTELMIGLQSNSLSTALPRSEWEAYSLVGLKLNSFLQ